MTTLTCNKWYCEEPALRDSNYCQECGTDQLWKMCIQNRNNRIAKTKKVKLTIISIVMTIGTAVAILLTQVPFAKADSVICDSIIYTQTSSIETNIENLDVIKIRSLAYPRGWVQIYPWLLYDNDGYDGRISISDTRCTFIRDEIDSVDNLKWYLNILRLYGE